MYVPLDRHRLPRWQGTQQYDMVERAIAAANRNETAYTEKLPANHPYPLGVTEDCVVLSEVKASDMPYGADPPYPLKVQIGYIVQGELQVYDTIALVWRD